jgi:2-oxoglutarate ferredoxin oxidoreductase subunit beta
MAFDYDKYIRPGKLPHIWCPGCGHGIVMKGLIRAIDALSLDKDMTAIVSGIGCASRLPGYLDFCTLHTTHGRAVGFATGIKMAKPEMNVICVGGDGDGVAIGGNHFIHACRRNIDMTYLIMNNNIYGMTGGQFSPTTPYGAKASTTPYGNPDPPFDIAKLALVPAQLS